MRFIQWRTMLGRDCAILLAEKPYRPKPFHDTPQEIEPEDRGMPLEVLRRLYPRKKRSATT